MTHILRAYPNRLEPGPYWDMYKHMFRKRTRMMVELSQWAESERILHTSMYVPYTSMTCKLYELELETDE